MEKKEEEEKTFLRMCEFLKDHHIPPHLTTLFFFSLALPFTPPAYPPRAIVGIRAL